MQLIQFFEYFYNWPNQYEHPKVSKIGSRGNRSPDVLESTKKSNFARDQKILLIPHMSFLIGQNRTKIKPGQDLKMA